MNHTEHLEVSVFEKLDTNIRQAVKVGSGKSIDPFRPFLPSPFENNQELLLNRSAREMIMNFWGGMSLSARDVRISFGWLLEKYLLVCGFNHKQMIVRGESKRMGFLDGKVDTDVVLHRTMWRNGSQ